MVGFRYYMSGLMGNIPSSGQASQLIQQLGLQFSPNDFVLLGISLFGNTMCSGFGHYTGCHGGRFEECSDYDPAACVSYYDSIFYIYVFRYKLSFSADQDIDNADTIQSSVYSFSEHNTWKLQYCFLRNNLHVRSICYFDFYCWKNFLYRPGVNCKIEIWKEKANK